MYHHTVEEIFCINEINIRSNFLKEPPYMEVEFKPDNLKDVQKELIYRLFLEERFLKRKNTYQTKTIIEGIELVLLENYNELYNITLERGYTTIIAYLLSQSLIKENDTLMDAFCLAPPKCVEKNTDSFKDFYASIISADIFTKRLDIFPIDTYSELIKYPEQFIEDNFKEFITEATRTPFCYSIDFQKPSFETLIKHIGEIGLPCIKNCSYLTEEQIDELVLLHDMVNS